MLLKLSQFITKNNIHPKTLFHSKIVGEYIFFSTAEVTPKKICWPNILLFLRETALPGFSLDYGNNDKKERHETPLRAALHQEQRYGRCRWNKLRLRFWFGMQQVLLWWRQFFKLLAPPKGRGSWHTHTHNKAEIKQGKLCVCGLQGLWVCICALQHGSWSNGS